MLLRRWLTMLKISDVLDIREPKVHEVDGEIKPVENTVYVNPNKISITWYDYEGNEIDQEYDGKVPSHMWTVKIDGIPSDSVTSIEYPKITYDGKNDYLVKVVYTVYENI